MLASLSPLVGSWVRIPLPALIQTIAASESDGGQLPLVAGRDELEVFHEVVIPTEPRVPQLGSA